jgi:hypothetical protein
LETLRAFILLRSSIERSSLTTAMRKAIIDTDPTREERWHREGLKVRRNRSYEGGCGLMMVRVCGCGRYTPTTCGTTTSARYDGEEDEMS